MAQQVKNPPETQEMQEMWIWCLEGEDPLEEGMATYSSILSREIPWAEESGRLWSMGLQRVGTQLKWLSMHGTDFLETGSSFKTYLSSRQKKIDTEDMNNKINYLT